MKLPHLDIHRHRDRAIIIVSISVLVLLLPFVINRDRAAVSGSASLYFNQQPGTIPVGQTATVELRLRTLTTAANAVSLVMHYDPKILDLTKLTTSQSFCSFYTENSFDTIKGEVHLSCGTPNPGFNGDSVLLVLSLRGKNVGTATINFDLKNTMVLANDGKGTNILSQPPHLTISVMQSL